ncbi:putative enoyl CoA hydratase [Coelomomyces lativittatus]|nr:putative enoyl CoA hydratase [Coelomomyces lativittatus]
MQSFSFETLQLVFLTENIVNVQLNRPKKLNAINSKLFDEIGQCFNSLNSHPDVRVIILSSSNDSIFTAGLDLKEAQEGILPEENDIGRRSLKIMGLLKNWQTSFTSIEECRAPVICVINGGCIGGGVDLISAADIRICSADAYFSVKEVDLAMAPDIGTLQRLPKIVGNQSLVNEWCFTGRKISSNEAVASGLVSNVLPTKNQAMEHALDLARTIASKSPIAIVGIKYALRYAHTHSTKDGLSQIAMWNSSMLQSNDVSEAITATLSKRTPHFNKL